MTDSTLGQLLCSYFRSLNSRGIRYCVLRNYENLPADTDNDVDILVSRPNFHTAADLLCRIAEQDGLRLHMLVAHDCLKMVFHRLKAPLDQCHIDLYSDIRWQGIPITAPEEILDSREAYENFFIPGPAREQAVILLTSLLYIKRVRKKYRAGIFNTARHRTLGREMHALLIQAIGPHEGWKLWHAIRNEAWGAAAGRAWKIRQALIIKKLRDDPAGGLRGGFAMIRRLAGRLFSPAGLSVAVIGPDGAGKSSLIRKLGPALENTFKQNQCVVHWCPKIVPEDGPGQAPHPLPHARPQRPRLLSLAFFTYHSIMFVLGYGIRLAPFRLRGGMVFLDRYYYDFFVDPGRFRMTLPVKAAKLGYFFVPKPDMVLLLDAQPDLIRARKQEVSPGETRRQCKAYRQLIRHIPQGQILNANASPNRVADDALNMIMQFLTQRAACQRRRFHGK